MTEATYERFQQALGNIIIKWAVAEQHFRQLLAVVAGVAPIEGEIIFDRVSAINQRTILKLLAEERHSEGAQDDIDYCLRLHLVNSANRNLFAHGHIGFGTMGDQPPKASRVKLQIGKRPHNKMWEVSFDDVLRIADEIQEFDHYARYLAVKLPDDRAAPRQYVAGQYRPPVPTNHDTKGYDLDALLRDA